MSAGLGSRKAPAAGAAATETIRPSSYEEMAEVVRSAEAAGRPLIPAGLGNHLGLDERIPPGAAILSLEKLGKVMRYEPADFTIGVQAGMPLDELQALLRSNGQEVPVDFPSSPRGSVGGALAQCRHGPRRGRYGTLRPYLIGVLGMRGGGRAYRAGGMVVKNVAGYDVMKLLIGSRGALGPILEANFKLRPLPAARSGRRARFETAREAWSLVRAVRDAALDPAVLSVLNPPAARALEAAVEGAPRPAWTVLWSFEGNAAAVRWLEEEVDRLLTGVRPQEVSPLDPPGRAAAIEFLASAREAGSGSGEGLLILSLAFLASKGGVVEEALEEALRAAGGEEGWLISDGNCGAHLLRLAIEPASRDRGPSGIAERLLDHSREVVRRLGGNCQVLCGPLALVERRGRVLLPDRESLFPGPLPDRIRRAFDPRGIFGQPPPEAGSP